MKYGFRTPSFKKSFSARTKGRMTRSMNKAVNPLYGKKGLGWANNPQKAFYNSVYHRTTRSAFNSRSSASNSSDLSGYQNALVFLTVIPTAMIIASWAVGWLNGWLTLILIFVVPIGIARFLHNYAYDGNTMRLPVIRLLRNGKAVAYKCPNCGYTFEGTFQYCYNCHAPLRYKLGSNPIYNWNKEWGKKPY